MYVAILFSYGGYYLNPFSAGTDLRRQILTSEVDPRIENIQNGGGTIT